MATSPIRCTQEPTRTPRRPSSAIATAPAATRAAVSRALARSRTSRASPRPYLSIPARSAWPGRTRVTGLRVKPAAVTCIGPRQFSQSRLTITRATGEPRVRPPRTPATISARSCSICWRLPRPYPPWRRRRWGSMSRRASRRSPAGRPSTMTVSWGPWRLPGGQEAEHRCGRRQRPGWRRLGPRGRTGSRGGAHSLWAPEARLAAPAILRATLRRATVRAPDRGARATPAEG